MTVAQGMQWHASHGMQKPRFWACDNIMENIISTLGPEIWPLGGVALGSQSGPASPEIAFVPHMFQRSMLPVCSIQLITIRSPWPVSLANGSQTVRAVTCEWFAADRRL